MTYCAVAYSNISHNCLPVQEGLFTSKSLFVTAIAVNKKSLHFFVFGQQVQKADYTGILSDILW